jgi:DNA topoisomerase-3
MARKILCVAEKPAIARAVATHLSGGAFQTVGSLLNNSDDSANIEHSVRFAGINMSRTMNLISTLVVPGATARSQ